jgi:hypothetical protein
LSISVLIKPRFLAVNVAIDHASVEELIALTRLFASECAQEAIRDVILQQCEPHICEKAHEGTADAVTIDIPF